MAEAAPHPSVAFLLAAHEAAPYEQLLCEVRPQAADGHRITLHDPAAVLARIAAEREILAEHARSGYGVNTHCEVCADEDYDGAERLIRTPQPWPCGVWTGIAKAWGWTP